MLMPKSSGGGGNGGRTGGGGGGPLSDAQVVSTPYTQMPGWQKTQSEFSAEDKYGREVKPSVWSKDGKERLYVPWDPSRGPDKRNAGFVTKDVVPAPRYGKDMSFTYRGLTVVPDAQSRTGHMKRFVDMLTGHPATN